MIYIVCELCEIEYLIQCGESSLNNPDIPRCLIKNHMIQIRDRHYRPIQIQSDTRYKIEFENYICMIHYKLFRSDKHCDLCRSDKFTRHVDSDLSLILFSTIK